MDQLRDYGPEIIAGLFLLLALSSIILTYLVAEWVTRRLEQNEQIRKEERARYRKAEGLPEWRKARHLAAPNTTSSAAKIIEAGRKERERYSAENILKRVQKEHGKELTSA